MINYILHFSIVNNKIKNNLIIFLTLIWKWFILVLDKKYERGEVLLRI
jgi:hypothetical protein